MMMLREQKRALFAALISGLMLLATIAMPFLNDPATIFENDSLELAYLGFLLIGVAIYGVLALLTMKRKRGEEYVFDERDILIAARALIVQQRVVLISVAVWCIALVRIYIGKGGIPVPLMYIMFLSILFMNILARSLSIYRGYNLDIGDLERNSL